MPWKIFYKLVWFLVIFTFGLQFFGPLKSEASETNFTPKVEIHITKKNNQTLRVQYYILQTFLQESRGIFLSLPKNQNGIWTDYKINKIQKAQVDTLDQNISLESQNLKNINFDFQNEPYSNISEWNQMRFRVGDKDKPFINKTFLYYLDLEIGVDFEKKYDLILLRDWGDTIVSREVYYQDKNICDTLANCYGNKINFTINNTGQKPSSVVNFWYNTWIYWLGFFAIYSLLFVIWLRFFNQHKIHQKIDKPEYEPPQGVYPWEAQFLLDNDQIDLKNILLSYILWLNKNKYIELKNKPYPKTNKTSINLQILKDLPNLLPSVFNRTIASIAKNGIEKGIKNTKFGNDFKKDFHAHILNKYNYLYSRKPIFGMQFIFAIIPLVLFFIFISLFGTIQTRYLVGDSYGGWISFCLLISIPGLFVLGYFFEQYSPKGFLVYEHLKKYKFYLSKVEKHKLDFSNNPENGVQYYLENVPYAAAFGLLNKFNKYMQNIMPQEESINISSNFSTYLIATSLYNSPNSGPGFSSGGFSGGFSGGGGSW